MYKNFIMILSSYKCNKNCPYCIAKMDKLPSIKEDFNLLKKELLKLKKQNIKFKYFVLSGNGEPSLYSYEDLIIIKNIVEEMNIFEEKRIQTSGNLFLDTDKFNLFKDWLIEITRVDKSYNKDKEILKYKENYLDTNNFINAKQIRVNIVLLNNYIENLLNDIYKYFEISNVKTIALKILDNKMNTKEYKWIIDNAINYNEIDNIITILNNAFGKAYKEYNNYIWKYKDKYISLYYNENYNTEKVNENYMWLGNKKL